MFINVIVFLVILILTFVNGLTDATNSISTLVGTKVMNFRKACMLSAFFDIIGIFVMYYINNSISDCISSIAILPKGILGLTVLCIGMLSAILFSTISMFFGNPTSESHGLISGITGAAIASIGLKSVNIEEWGNVILGLIWSVGGTIIFCKIISLCVKNSIKKFNINKIKKLQVYSCIRNVVCTWSTRWT